LACEEENEIAGGLAKCHLCGTVNTALKSSDPPQSAKAQRSTTVKLSFRGSGHKSFLGHLAKALEKKAWLESERRARSAQESRQFVAGVSGLMKKAESDRQRQAVDQTEAFGDLDGLMRQAGEMAKLAETIVAKLAARQQGDTLGDAEDREFRALIADLGLSSGTANVSKSAYHSELAKQVSAFTERLFSLKSLQIVTLADLYCYFNRARGNDLVSPSDLHKAASLMDTLGLPVKLRPLSSGLLVLQSTSFSDGQLASRLTAPVTPVGLAAQESISIQLATELLAALDFAGNLCRDQTPSGPAYYPNLILQP
jgi:ESCRT-II complex subunit VPS36